MGVPFVEQSFLTNQQKVLKKKSFDYFFSLQLELGFEIDPFLLISNSDIQSTLDVT